MPYKLKIIIGCVSILAIIIVGLFFLNKELPGCFSSNFLSKIKTDVGCFELAKYPLQEYSSKLEEENDILSKNFFLYQTIENTSKDYFKKISPTIQDPNLKILVSVGILNNVDYSIKLSTTSSKLENLNKSIYNNIYKEYGYFDASYFIKNDNATNYLFSGFIIPEGETASYEKDFNKLLLSYYPNIKLN